MFVPRERRREGGRRKDGGMERDKGERQHWGGMERQREHTLERERGREGEREQAHGGSPPPPDTHTLPASRFHIIRLPTGVVDRDYAEMLPC